MGDVKSDDYYKVLGVSKSATEAEIAKGVRLASSPLWVAIPTIHHMWVAACVLRSALVVNG